MSTDATVYQGTDNTLALVIYQTSAEATVQDLSDYEVIAYRVGKALTDQTVLEVTDTENANGSVVYFGTRANGEVNVALTKADLAALRAMRYAHQLILADGDGNRQVVTDGYLTVRETLPSAS